jgi:hypothetical protein
MLRILFWNLNKNPRTVALLSRIVHRRNIDIAIVAERSLETNDLCRALSDATQSEFRPFLSDINKRIEFFAKPAAGVGAAIGESPYLTLRAIQPNGSEEFILGGIHSISRLEADLLDLDEEACVASKLIRDVEALQAHRKTIVIGDFNLNPFDHGMAKVRGYFGVMSEQDARRESQQLKYNSYPLFYNPMWSRMGDESPGPPGTFYRGRTSHLPYYWQTYDQVLVRPQILSAFDGAELEVVSTIGEVELLKNGSPDSLIASDHLPILIGLDLSKIEGGN